MNIMSVSYLTTIDIIAPVAEPKEKDGTEDNNRFVLQKSGQSEVFIEMEQDSASHQVIEQPREETRIRDTFSIKAATTVFGVIQLICGIVALVVFITSCVVNDGTFSFDNSIWSSILFFVSGMLGLGGAQSKSMWLMATTLLLAISSSASAGFLLWHLPWLQLQLWLRL